MISICFLCNKDNLTIVSKKFHFFQLIYRQIVHL